MKRVYITEEQYQFIIETVMQEQTMLDESLTMKDVGRGLYNIGKGIGKATLWTGKKAGELAYKTGRGAYNFTRDKIARDIKSCKTPSDYCKMICYYVITGSLTISGAINITKATIDKLFPGIDENIIEQVIDKIENLEGKIENADFNQEEQNLHSQKVKEVDNLIRQSRAIMGFTDEPDVSAENIVSMCEKYNFYLPLLLAQAHLESHFGVTNRAQNTNSIFSVGAYDDGRDIVRYKTKDDSVEAYIKLMKNDYLSDKSVKQLLSNKGFVNSNGDRYASNKNYERDIRATMNGIVKKTCPNCF